MSKSYFGKQWGRVKFHCYIWPNIEQNICLSGHTDCHMLPVHNFTKKTTWRQELFGQSRKRSSIMNYCTRVPIGNLTISMRLVSLFMILVAFLRLAIGPMVILGDSWSRYWEFKIPAALNSIIFALFLLQSFISCVKSPKLRKKKPSFGPSSYT